MLNHKATPIFAAACLGAITWTFLSPDIFAHAGSQQSSMTTAKFASVDALAIVARMLESDAYKQPNLANAEKYDAELRRMLQELEGVRTRALAEAESSDARKALESEFIEKNSQFEQARATAQQAIEQFNTDQVAEAYRLVCEAANALAQTSGYTHVIVSRTTADPIKSNTVAGAVQEMLARPLIRSVPADDLTAQLLRSFKLESVAVSAETQPNPAAPK